jgi:hypothetical protein
MQKKLTEELFAELKEIEKIEKGYGIMELNEILYELKLPLLEPGD